MFKKLCLTAGLVALTLFAACKALPTVQEQFATGCTIVNGDLAIVGKSPLLTVDQQNVINIRMLPANQAICKAGTQLNVADLKEFHDSLLPAAITLVQAVPALPDQQAILVGLQTFGPLVQAMIDQLITAVAPAAASTPLAGSPLQ